MWPMRLSCVLATFFVAVGANAQDVAAIHPAALAPRANAFMREYALAEAPHGFLAFCQEYPRECAPSSRGVARVVASPERLRELDEINRDVNQSIKPESDFDHYGVSEYWTLPKDGKGDCEDYALLKRHKLIQRGWPSGALLVTVVRDEHGDGHAVLTARTTGGDFVLDNKVGEVVSWTALPYQFVLRQSSAEPRAWTRLDDAREQLSVPVAVAHPQR